MDRNQLSHGGCQVVESNILSRQHTKGSRKVTEYGSSGTLLIALSGNYLSRIMKKPTKLHPTSLIIVSASA